MSPIRHNRADHLLAWLALGSIFLLLLTFLTASSLASAPTARIVKKLNLNDRLTVKGKGCQPQVQSQADAKIVIRCVKNKAQSAEPNTPDTKITLVLNAGDKLIVKRSACRLQVTSLSNTRVWIICDKGPLPPIVPDTTKPLSSETTQYLTSVSPDGATFTFSQATDQLNTLQVGDVMVSNPTQAAPDGFLRKVTSVTNNAGQIVVQTEVMTIADSVQQGEISVSQVLQPTNLERATFAEGVTIVKRPDAPSSFYLQLNDVVLYDEDGNTSTTNDQINANGSILLDPRFDFRLKVENFQLKELYFTTTASETSQLKIGSKIFVTAKIVEKELARYPLGPLFFTIGPFPVTVYPVITITAGIDGTIQANVSTGVTQSLTETAGVSYANGAWSPIQQFTNQFQYDAPTLSAGLEIKGYTGAKLKILFYGSVGPDIGINAYLKLEANPLQTPWWKLYGGLEVPVGISIEIFSHVIAGWNATVIDFRILLKQADTPPHSTATAIAAGGSHTCALTTSGGVKCWGYNGFGELGNGTTSDSNVPVGVSGLGGGVSAITAGEAHTCALTTTGSIKCWGRNSSGELGDGTTTDRHTPVGVSGLTSGIRAITAGDSHICALTTSGGVKCWGGNGSGQLGNGTNTNSNVPVDVCADSTCISELSGISAIVAGYAHTCALTTSGEVKCWGHNGVGELGNGTNMDSQVPVDVCGDANCVGSLSSLSASAAGGFHTCAVMTSGGAKCWGRNGSGELGNGTNTDSNVPVNVSSLTSGTSAMTAGWYHTCTLTTSGGVKCWGRNASGQLGNGTNTSNNVPVNVSSLTSGVQRIEAGSHHTCALTTSGGIKCWGANFDGELGNGTNTDSNVPVNVVGFEP